MDSESFENVTGVVLAGGRSSRFGENKALAKLEGKTLIECIVSGLASLFPRLLIVTNQPEEFRFLGIETAEDAVKGLGPIGGIFTALKIATDPYIFVTACDMPALNFRLIHRLVSLRESHDVVVPRIGKWLEPLHAVYGRRCLEPIEALVRTKQYQILRLFPSVRVRFVEKEELEQMDPDLGSFYNINTREDLRLFLMGKKRDAGKPCS